MLLSSLVSGSASGQATDEEFVTGSGNAYAQVFRVGPTAARLSLAPILGLSLADYLNTVGRGEVKAAEWAAVGVAEPALPDNTPRIKVNSNQPGAAKGQSQIVAGGTDASGNGGGLMELYARATKAPFGESRFRQGRFGITGLIEIDGGESHTTAGIIQTKKGPIREARAVSEIDELSLGGGAVTLSGMRWEAIQRTGESVEEVTGKFTVQSGSVGGESMEFPAGGSELKSVLEPINAGLAPIGLVMTAPEIDKRAGVARVSPMSIEIINSPAGRMLLAPILAAAQPVREPLTDALIEGSGGELSVAILVADLTLGIFSGSSQLHIELGGVNAFTEGQAFSSPFGPAGGFTPPAVGPSGTVVVPGRPGRAAVPPTEVIDEGELVAGLPGAAPGQRTVPGDRGGVAAAVGLIGLAVAIALAVADYRRMRASRRAIAAA